MDAHQHNMKMADPGQEKTPSDQGTAVPTAPTLDVLHPPQNDSTAVHPQYGAIASGATPYTQQPYPPESHGVYYRTLEQPPPYPGPPQPGYQQPYQPPGYQQPFQPPAYQQPYHQIDTVDNTLPQQADPNTPLIVRTGQEDVASRPKDYYCMAVCSIFCCPIFGIIACCYSSQVEKLWFQRRYAEARSSSARAKGWSIVAISIGLSFFAIYSILAITLNIKEP